MTARRTTVLALIAGAFLFASAADLRAASIGVNLIGTSGTGLASGDSAGVESQTNWQNVAGTSASSLTLLDNTGAATSALLTFTAGLSGFHTGSPAGADESLNNTYVASFTPQTFTIGSIPYAAYDLLIYNMPAISQAYYEYKVGSTTYYGTRPAAGAGAPGYVDGNSGTAYTYIQATSTASGSPTANSDYARFDGLTGSSLTFTITGAGGVGYASAFQIIEVPEPSRAALMMAGILAFAARRRRA